MIFILYFIILFFQLMIFYKQWNRYNGKFNKLSFEIYIIILLTVTLLSRVGNVSNGEIYLELFHSYKMLLHCTKELFLNFFNLFKVGYRWIIPFFVEVSVGLFGNILLFVPFGFELSAIISLNHKNKWIIITLGLTASFLIEVIQSITKLGCFDVDDIFNNTLGCIIGICIVYITKKNSYNKSK